MRIIVVTDEAGETLEESLAVCRDLGITTVELRKVDGLNLVEHTPESLTRIKAQLDNGGFQVCNIASPFIKCPFWAKDPAGRESAEAREWAILERSFELAHFFGASMV